ncbi:MAG: hypothetical protein GQ534_06765 [Candidatus Delongbacteria bacterium]|nr:hypothetical protein [Candidatus Delongbacteria bacterium]
MKKYEIYGPITIPSRIAGGNFQTYLYKFSSSRRYIVLEKGICHEIEDLLIRVDSNCTLGMLFGSARCECAEQLHLALIKVNREGNGLIIHALDQDGRGIPLEDHFKVYMEQEKGYDTVEADYRLNYSHYDRREYEDVVQIFNSYKLKKIRLMTNNPERLDYFRKAGFEIQRISHEVMPLDLWNSAQNYIKKTKMNHLFDFDDGNEDIQRMAKKSIAGGFKEEYTGFQWNTIQNADE